MSTVDKDKDRHDQVGKRVASQKEKKPDSNGRRSTRSASTETGQETDHSRSSGGRRRSDHTGSNENKPSTVGDEDVKSERWKMKNGVAKAALEKISKNSKIDEKRSGNDEIEKEMNEQKIPRKTKRSKEADESGNSYKADDQSNAKRDHNDHVPDDVRHPEKSHRIHSSSSSSSSHSRGSSSRRISSPQIPDEKQKNKFGPTTMTITVEADVHHPGAEQASTPRDDGDKMVTEGKTHQGASRIDGAKPDIDADDTKPGTNAEDTRPETSAPNHRSVTAARQPENKSNIISGFH